MAKKMTKRDYFNELLAITEEMGKSELSAFIEKELNLLAKKNSGERKPTALQVANEEIKERILEWMEIDHLYTITEIQKGVSICADLSNQRISALVTQLVKAEKAVRTVDKRRAYFSKAK